MNNKLNELPQPQMTDEEKIFSEIKEIAKKYKKVPVDNGYLHSYWDDVIIVDYINLLK